MARKKRPHHDKSDPLITRRDMASWVEGPPQGEAGDYAGKRLGLPIEGPTSIASLGRRIGALFVDWIIASALSWLTTGGDSLVTLLIFLAMHWLMIALLGATIGKALFRIQVVRLGGGPVGFWRPLVRALLLGLVIPPVVMDQDQRGIHDRVAGTVEINA